MHAYRQHLPTYYYEQSSICRSLISNGEEVNGGRSQIGQREAWCETARTARQRERGVGWARLMRGAALEDGGVDRGELTANR